MSKFVITITTYNAEKYIARAIITALLQTYEDYEIIVIDDCSTDNTWSEICRVLYSSPQKKKVRAIRKNRTRVGVLANHYQMAQMCQDDEIIVNLDGDDQLAHEGVLNVLDTVYSDSNVWMTYGSFAYDKQSRNPDPNADPRGICSPFPPDRHDRTYFFVCSHLRTYKKWLFDRIRIEDLKKDGDFYQLAMDHALMFPMIEMSGSTHARYIHDILYFYNAVNNLNEHTLVGRDVVMKIADYIKSEEVYPKLPFEKSWPNFN
jgi:glycosyltransferase involved in cell wall biosynthesis